MFEQRRVRRKHDRRLCRVSRSGDLGIRDVIRIPEVRAAMLGTFVIMLGFPIAFSLMAMGVGFAFYYFDFRETPVFALVVRKTFDAWS